MIGARSSEMPSRDDIAARPRQAVLAFAVKRLVDLSLGLALAAVALPFMVVVGVAIRMDSPGPVLFRPRRIGRHGKPLDMLKFRSMAKGAASQATADPAGLHAAGPARAQAGRIAAGRHRPPGLF